MNSNMDDLFMQELQEMIERSKHQQDPNLFLPPVSVSPEQKSPNLFESSDNVSAPTPLPSLSFSDTLADRRFSLATSLFSDQDTFIDHGLDLPMQDPAFFFSVGQGQLNSHDWIASSPLSAPSSPLLGSEAWPE